MNSPLGTLIKAVLCMTFSMVQQTLVQAAPTESPSQQTQLPSNLEKTLKDIPQKGLACLANPLPVTMNGETSTLNATPRRMPKRDRSCLMSVTQMANSKLPWQIIDVRMPAEYQRFQVNGAINLQADLIKSKTYLAKQPVLLLGDGKSDELLEETCFTLKQDGFSEVRILTGGMLTWAKSKFPLVGIEPDAFMLAQLTPAELYRENTHVSNVIINALPNGTVPLPIGAGANNVAMGKWIASIADVITKRKKNGVVDKVLIVAGERLDRKIYNDLSAAFPLETLLIYTDTQETYSKFVRGQMASLERQAKGPRQPSCGL